jgi:hypothetical protein
MGEGAMNVGFIQSSFCLTLSLSLILLSSGEAFCSVLLNFREATKTTQKMFLLRLKFLFEDLISGSIITFFLSENPYENF